MQSDEKTIEEYISELPHDRQDAIRKVRKVILENLPEGFEEVMNWGMITYQVPLSVFPDTYNKKPFMYAVLASQKNHMVVYLSSIYTDEIKRAQFEQAYRATGKCCDVGKSCVRFRKLDDLPLPLIGKAIASIGMADFIELVKKAGSVRKSKKKN
ncbi:MAG: DUF1801 domain-containing protein [Pelolinea sp.]|nr:DUF1801 domain-containing protein [Pelolinea sp.]